MSESEYSSSSSESSSEEDLGSDYDPKDFESSSSEDSDDDEDFEVPTRGKRKAPAKKKSAPVKKKAKVTATTKKKVQAKKPPTKKASKPTKASEGAKENRPIGRKTSTTKQKKAPAKKKLNAKECEAAILDYLGSTNRPYSDKEVYDNMHKPMPYAKFRVLLDKLYSEDKIGHRVNGKFKLYWPRQDNYETLSKEDMGKMDLEITEKREEIRALESNLKIKTNTILKLKALPTLEELKTNLKKVKEEYAEKTKKLSELKSGASKVDPAEREKLTKEVKKFKNLWKERRNNCLDVFDQIIEGSSKSEKKMYEEWGLETAADANGPTLKEFTNIIKQL